MAHHHPSLLAIPKKKCLSTTVFSHRSRTSSELDTSYDEDTKSEKQIDMIVYGIKIDPTIDSFVDKHISESSLIDSSPRDLPTPRSIIPYAEFDSDLTDKSFYFDTMKKLYDHYKFNIIKIDLDKYMTFVNEVYNGYNSYILFHTAKHSIDAVIMMHQLIDAIQSKERIFSNYEIFALIIGMLSHDIGHFGLNNNYIVKYMPEIVEKYGTESTLEHFHLEKTLDLIRKTNLLNDLPESFQKQILCTIETLIVATDPSTTTSLIKKYIESSSATITKCRIDGTYGTHQNNKIRLIAKCADMAHFIRDYIVHDKWSKKITDEFHHQGDLELKTFGKITIPLCNRKDCNIIKSQIWFIQNYVLPLFKFANHVFNQMLCYHLIRINENLKMWKDKEFDDIEL